MSEQTDETPKCPHCGEPFSLDVISKAKHEHQLAFSLMPKPGELICATTIGGTLTELENLFATIGEDIGTKTKLLVERMETDDEGKHTVHFLVARVAMGISDD